VLLSLLIPSYDFDWSGNDRHLDQDLYQTIGHQSGILKQFETEIGQEVLIIKREVEADPFLAA
jgi:hypothetical protein